MLRERVRRPASRRATSRWRDTLAERDLVHDQSANDTATAVGESARVDFTSRPVTPRDEDRIHRLAALWQDVLSLPAPPSAEDNFFSLGGNSLAAIRLIEKMATEFGASLEFADLLHAENFEAVAVTVEKRAVSHPPSPSAVHVNPADLHAPFPLTEVQRAYWLGRTRLFELGGVAAHGYVEIDGDGLDHDRLEAALNRTIQRHPMLRATIGSDGLQYIASSVPNYEIACIELTGRTDGERTASLAATREAMAHQVLAADRWPLFDIRHSRLPNDRSRLHISFDVLMLDLASLERWISEWALFYEKPNSQLEPPTVHFGDYVRTLATLRQGKAGQKALAYWEQRLETLPPCPELPLARDPSAVGTPRFRRLDAELPAHAWQSLRNQAAAMGLTPSIVLLTAYAEVLGQWSRSQHFTLNLTAFNRLPLGPGFDTMLGDFTSLMLLEADLREQESFADRARRLQSQLWKDLDHRLISGVEVMARLAARQRTPRRALMPVVFTSGLGIDNLYDAFERFGGITHSVTQTPQTWLDHQALERNGGLLLIWDSVETLFPDGVLDTMFAAYVDLVHALADDGPARWDRPVGALLPPTQLASRAAANATEADITPGLLHRPFLATACLQPEAPAVIAPDHVLDYRTLDRASVRLARRLQALGAGRNQLVAICLPRGWRQVLAAVAVVRAGAAYLPLDPTLPTARLHMMLSQGNARLVLTEKHQRTAWPDGAQTLVVDTDLLAEDADESAPLSDVAGPDDLAYVIFTSGSTGTPKGVMVEHRAALNTILDVNKRFGVGPADRGIALSALGFDLSVYDIFGLLGAGAALVVPPPSQSPEPATWRRLIADTGVTVWNTVPALLRIYADYLNDHRASIELARLRLVMTSGDWLPVSLAETIAALPGERRFVSLGGATEAAIWSIAQPIEQVNPDWTSVPYGKPLANQRLHILDRHFRPCPDWVPGDIYIAGLGLARGYWGDREQTQRSFVFHPDTGERLYRTGDVGRYGSDGTIHFLGRSDDQVKVNGLRVELGEIESALARKPGVRQAAAVVVRSPDFGDRLVAFAVPAGAGIDAEALRADLRQELPANLVPVAIYAVDTIPLTRNAKVDRNALTNEVMQRTQQSAETFRAPADAIEARIADIWCELLTASACSVDRNFFEAGGTSLLATRLAQRLGQAFHLSVPVVALFEHPTIAAQAVYIREVNADRQEAPHAAQGSLRGEERRRLLLAATRAPTGRIPS